MRSSLTFSIVTGLLFAPGLLAQNIDPRLESFKEEALNKVQDQGKLVQEIVDHLYSFGELGMQEFETQRYLTDLLEENGPSGYTAGTWSCDSGVEVVDGEITLAVGDDVTCEITNTAVPAEGTVGKALVAGLTAPSKVPTSYS